MTWINSTRKAEQGIVKPPAKEVGKCVPKGTLCGLRKAGDDEWKPFILRRTIALEKFVGRLDGFFYTQEGEYELRAHRTDITIAAFEVEHPKDNAPCTRKPKVIYWRKKPKKKKRRRNRKGWGF